MPQFFSSSFFDQFKLLVATLNTVSQRNQNCENSPKHFRCYIIKGFGTPMEFQMMVIKYIGYSSRFQNTLYH